MSNVSLVDLSPVAKRKTSVAEVNSIVVKAANGKFENVLAVCAEPLVSCDFKGHSASSIFDGAETLVGRSGRLVKVLTWYDD